MSADWWPPSRLLLESIFNPGAEAIIEVKYADEKEQAESADPNRPRPFAFPPTAPTHSKERES